MVNIGGKPGNTLFSGIPRDRGNAVFWFTAILNFDLSFSILIF